MADGATTGTVGLLERSAELDALGEPPARRSARRAAAGSCSSPARPGSARRRSCGRSARAAPPPRVLWGACDALFTPRPLGPLVDIATRSGGELARRRRRGRRAGRRRRGARGELRGGRPTSSCSRTCTGPTRRRSTSCACSPAASSRSRRSCWPPTATTSSTAPTRCGSCWASCPAARRRGWRSRRCRAGRGRELAGALGVDHARAAPADRRQPVLRDRGAGRGRRRAPRDASATPCSPAPRG